MSVWWKTKRYSWRIYMSHIHWVEWGTGTPKDRNEVNKREVFECFLFLLLIDQSRAKEKTYICVLVWWKTESQNRGSYKPHIHWVTRGTGTPKDRDEVNKRNGCECDGRVCDLDGPGSFWLFFFQDGFVCFYYHSIIIVVQSSRLSSLKKFILTLATGVCVRVGHPRCTYILVYSS